jgi:hypothetical protein
MALWACDWEREEIDPDVLASELLTEVQMTKGILPIFSFSLRQNGSVNEEPIPWSRGWYVLGGTLVGFVISALVIIFKPPSGIDTQVEG